MNEQCLIKQALIERSDKSTTKAFSKLVVLYQVRLYNYLLARCQNKYDAEDVLQDTFISAYKYLHSYKNGWQFSTWLFTIANRLICKQKKMYNQSLGQLINEQSATVFPNTINRNNIWIEIKKSLNPKSYDVLWFFYVEEYSIKEIAKIVAKSQSWVKITLFRSKKKLATNKEVKFLSQDFLM